MRLRTKETNDEINQNTKDDVFDNEKGNAKKRSKVIKKDGLI